ncbi:hypothetical protein [Shewanella gelidii]|uniref:DUF3015 domain-containing protein n=1 Tax=Shewanella gelidii TaxID=1642821 RepID=A0A917NB75_9GAMM|nr:hypothetical protein [Shewanella gelidii]MCL1097944.1 hypothetical protein [Shewanella gelidii]GGI84869.1 hypothetical protein GCM10009332_22760 [Shewanella gelidii]
MKKSVGKAAWVGGVLLAMMSMGAVATGGGGSGYAGSYSVTQDNLAASWNGQSGIQQAAVGGVQAQWHADTCGQLTAQVNNLSGWGAIGNAEQFSGKRAIQLTQSDHCTTGYAAVSHR